MPNPTFELFVLSLDGTCLLSFFSQSLAFPAPVSLPMSTFSVLVFDPVLPVNATGDDLIDRLQLPDSLLSSEHLTRGGPDATAEYDDRRLELIGAPPTTPNGSFLDGSVFCHAPQRLDTCCFHLGINCSHSWRLPW
jgi:hypothetical protein